MVDHLKQQCDLQQVIEFFHIARLMLIIELKNYPLLMNLFQEEFFLPSIKMIIKIKTTERDLLRIYLKKKEKETIREKIKRQI